MTTKAKAAMGVGLALDLAGLALIVSAIPDGGWRLAAGLGALLAGTWLVSRSTAGPAPSRDARERPDDPPRDWRPEPELRAKPPRRVRLTVTARIVAAAWALMLAAGAFYARVEIWDRQPSPAGREMLEAEGARAAAVVHRREVRFDAQNRERYVLYYQFRDETGTAVRSSATVPKRTFDRHQEGSSLEVVYVPGDPVAHYSPELTRPAFAVRGLLMAAVAASFFVFVLEGRRRRHRRLVSAGTAAPAVAANVRRRGASRAYEARYRVRGEERTLRVVERNPGRREGDIVTVLYDPNRPDEAELYLQCLYRAVQA